MLRRLHIAYWLCLVLSSFGIQSQSCQAATLHAIVVCNTTDESIGKGVNYNLHNMHQEMVKIADYADLELSEKIFSDEDYEPVQIFTYLEALEVEEDDVIFYYHSSHGFRTFNMDEQWPALFFGWSTEALRLSDIVDVIKAKPQRFAMVMADVCNNFVPEDVAPEFYHKPSGFWDYIGGWWGKDDSLQRENYQHLFRDFQGTIVSSGSLPGQYSWINLYSGSFYTNSILSSLRECSRSLTCEWDDVLSLAVEKTISLSQLYEGVTRQDPQYSIEPHDVDSKAL